MDDVEGKFECTVCRDKGQMHRFKTYQKLRSHEFNVHGIDVTVAKKKADYLTDSKVPSYAQGQIKEADIVPTEPILTPPVLKDKSKPITVVYVCIKCKEALDYHGSDELKHCLKCGESLVKCDLKVIKIL